MKVIFDFFKPLLARVLEIDLISDPGDIFSIIILFVFIYAVPLSLISFVKLILYIRKVIIIKKEMVRRGTNKVIYNEEAYCIKCKEVFESRLVNLNKWFYDRSLYPLECRKCRNGDSIIYLEARTCASCGKEIHTFNEDDYCSDCVENNYKLKNLGGESR